MEETAQYFKKRFFYEQILDFHCQNFMPHIEITKFCQNHWSLMFTDVTLKGGDKKVM